MNSIAITFKSEDNPTKEKSQTNDTTKNKSQDDDSSSAVSNDMELHINLWKMRSGQLQLAIKYYIDFGIMTSLKNNHILIYVPFSLENKYKWKDLGETICKDNDLLCAIFNQELKAAPNQKNKCFYEVSSNNYPIEEIEQFKPFLFYTLDEDSLKIEDDKETKGSWIKISIPSQTVDSKVERYYIRFRLNIEEINAIAFQTGISNDLIQAAFSKLDMYDLRFNDHRNLRKKIKEKIQKEYYIYPSFSKVHIFYVSNPKTSVENGSITKCDSRIIEPEVWKEYQPSKLYDKCQIAHHWKFKSNICDDGTVRQQEKKEGERVGSSYADGIMDIKKRKCQPLFSINLFFTAKYPQIESWTLIAYFAIIVLMGTAGSWLADFKTSDKFPIIGYELNLKKCIVIILIIVVVILWCCKHIRFPKGTGFQFD